MYLCVVVLLTTELVSLQEEESVRTLGVLDVDRWKEHAHTQTTRFLFELNSPP